MDFLGWKTRGFVEITMAIVREGREVLGPDFLMYKKKIFLEAITCAVCKKEDAERVKCRRKYRLCSIKYITGLISFKCYCSPVRSTLQFLIYRHIFGLLDMYIVNKCG